MQAQAAHWRGTCAAARYPDCATGLHRAVGTPTIYPAAVEHLPFPPPPSPTLYSCPLLLLLLPLAPPPLAPLLLSPLPLPLPLAVPRTPRRPLPLHQVRLQPGSQRPQRRVAHLEQGARSRGCFSVTLSGVQVSSRLGGGKSTVSIEAPLRTMGRK